MAIQTPEFLQPGAAQKALVARIAERYGIDAARFIRVSMKPNFVTGAREYVFNFRAIPMSREFSDAMRKIEQLITDEFRGPIIAAAVPELYAAQRHALAMLRILTDTQVILLTDQQLYDFMESPHEKSRHLSISSPPFC
jgi:hypothetical protein